MTLDKLHASSGIKKTRRTEVQFLAGVDAPQQEHQLRFALATSLGQWVDRTCPSQINYRIAPLLSGMLDKCRIRFHSCVPYPNTVNIHVERNSDGGQISVWIWCLSHCTYLRHKGNKRWKEHILSSSLALRVLTCLQSMCLIAIEERCNNPDFGYCLCRVCMLSLWVSSKCFSFFPHPKDLWAGW